MKQIRVNTLLVWLVYLIAMNSCKPTPDYKLNKKMELNQNWTFCKKGDTAWLPASVPGCVHTDLLTQGKIPDPFYRNNEKDLQWIDKENWIYRCTFDVDTADLNNSQAFLNFEGLDTYAEVSLNGQPILEANNMFRSWRVEVKNILQTGTNILDIEFKSPIKIGLQKLDELGYGFPAANDQSEVGGLGDKKVSVFTRKAPYHFGWDWGPRFVTSGIWRPVELEFVHLAHIDNIHYKQTVVNTDEASIDVVFEIDVWAGGEYTLRVNVNDNKSPVAEKQLALQHGINSVTVPVKITNPNLWWPNGMGEQSRYKFAASLLVGNTAIDTASNYIGLRSIELVRNPDERGASFYFRVNGVPVFAKGANYIPNDNFLNRVSPEKYEHVIASAAESNMNMLRVWGGGIYENDIFYELCDKYGLLVWQDFMFACSMYPGDDAFLANVEQEAVENVKRLRNYACIALWCGNNEIDAAWCEGDMDCGWDWKDRYTAEQRKAIWHSYDTLFHKMLPEIIQLYDPNKAYWPSSPQADWNEHATYSTTKGDIHYWGVWHGNEPFSSYYKVIGRFMSEYGFQSLPEKTSIGKFTQPEDWDFESEVLLSHQRSGYGNSRILDYMEKLYPVPDDFDQRLYIGQVMQAEAIKMAISAHRAAKPYCMGTLYWQLNDCWPAASWSSMDYYGSWKALQYFAKKAYEPVTISFYPDEDNLRIFLNSDLQNKQPVKVTCQILDFTGNIKSDTLISTTLDPAGAVEALVLDTTQIARQYNLEDIFVRVSLEADNKLLTEDSYYLAAPKDLNLLQRDIEMKTTGENNKLKLTVSTRSLVKNLYFFVENCDTHFSDNYFDLLPGETKSIVLESTECKQVEAEDIQIISLNDILNP